MQHTCGKTVAFDQNEANDAMEIRSGGTIHYERAKRAQ